MEADQISKIMDGAPFHQKTPKFQTTAFAVFVNKTRDQVLLENPTLTRVELIQKLAAMWACLPPASKATFSDDVSSSTPRFDFAFDEPLRSADPVAPAEEAVVCASSVIVQLDAPTDPQGYLAWVGAHVVNHYVMSHGDLPNDLSERLARGDFVTAPTIKASGDFGLSEVLRSLPMLETPT